ncbi:hypothetical protein [Jiangella alkaliphila]|uniref:hypothetical protein n=1 Tax=Jiangella alkaliphila TaxID=419479 RepID=UPI000699D9BF|nr:hypothetical protein [Jiangella alkaliphila]
MSLLFAGLFAGFLLAVLVLETSLRAFDASVYTQVRQVELDRLDALASATLLPALAATVVLVVAERGRGTCVTAGRSPTPRGRWPPRRRSRALPWPH